MGGEGEGKEESGQKEARKGEGVQEAPLTPGIRPGAEGEGRSETGRGAGGGRVEEGRREQQHAHTQSIKLEIFADTKTE